MLVHVSRGLSVSLPFNHIVETTTAMTGDSSASCLSFAPGGVSMRRRARLAGAENRRRT